MNTSQMTCQTPQVCADVCPVLDPMVGTACVSSIFSTQEPSA